MLYKKKRVLAIMKSDGVLKVCLCLDFTHLHATTLQLVPTDSLFAIKMVSVRLHNYGTCGAWGVISHEPVGNQCLGHFLLEPLSFSYKITLQDLCIV